MQKYVQMVTDHYSYMNKMSCDKCYKVHRNTVGRAELFFADYRGTADLLWRRQWHPTPVFSPGNSHGQRSLVGYSPGGHKRVGHNLVTKQPQQLVTVYEFQRVSGKVLGNGKGRQGGVELRTSFMTCISSCFLLATPLESH